MQHVGAEWFSCNRDSSECPRSATLVEGEGCVVTLSALGCILMVIGLHQVVLRDFTVNSKGCIGFDFHFDIILLLNYQVF